MMKDTKRTTAAHPRRGLKKIIAWGTFFIAGSLVATGVNGIRPLVAKDFNSETYVSAEAPAMMPSSFAELADKLSPTVVNVRVTKTAKAGFNQLPEGLFENGPFGEHFGKFFQQMPRQAPASGAGSGVIISNDGYILSNHHVVAGAKEILVILADKSEFPAEIIGTDSKTDLAVLKIDVEKDLPAAELGNSGQLKVGDWVVAIGNPFGLNHTVTSGIVSAKGRVIGAGPYDDFIQTDASINPGNSGGPLFNIHGRVVGINTAIIPHGQGIGFAIPVDTAKPLIPQLVNHGSITRGYLGVSIQNLSEELATALELENTRGVLVADVSVASPAEAAGLKRGDVILDFAGNTIIKSRDLSAKVAATPVGEEVVIRVYRNGKEKELAVVIGELATEPSLADTGASDKGKWGMQLAELGAKDHKNPGDSSQRGVAVMAVAPESPAARAGIRRGDTIVEINQKVVASLDEVRKELKKSDEDKLLLLVERNNGKFYVPLQMKG